jgi:hypothetical protein
MHKSYCCIKYIKSARKCRFSVQYFYCVQAGRFTNVAQWWEYFNRNSSIYITGEYVKYMYMYQDIFLKANRTNRAQTYW